MQMKSEVNYSIPESLANFDQLPDSAFIRLPTLMRLYGVSAATIWRNCSKGLIPSPIKLSERCTAWNVRQIRAALAAKVGA